MRKWYDDNACVVLLKDVGGMSAEVPVAIFFVTAFVFRILDLLHIVLLNGFWGVLVRGNHPWE